MVSASSRIRGSDATIMTESRTLQFESPRALQSLYANDIKLLKHLEDSLGVKVTTREGWMKLEGDPSRVDKAQQVFNSLSKPGNKALTFRNTNSITRSRP